jgi:hypothetical protein
VEYLVETNDNSVNFKGYLTKAQGSNLCLYFHSLPFPPCSRKNWIQGRGASGKSRPQERTGGISARLDSLVLLVGCDGHHHVEAVGDVPEWPVADGGVKFHAVGSYLRVSRRRRRGRGR